MELRHIKYFLAVAEELHFRKAAEKLFISQPGLSRQIKHLEKELGVVLFKRNNRNVVLTAVGEYLKVEFSNQIKMLNNTLQSAKLLQEGKKGGLKIGYVGSAMQDVIPKLLINFEKDNPNVLFDLKELDNKNQIDDLMSFNLDIGFVRMQRIPRDLAIKTILNEYFCLVLPEHHIIDNQNFKNLLQLKEASFILFDAKYSASYHEKVMQIFDDMSITPIISHNTVHASSIFRLVENNFGISIVPKSLANKGGYKVKFIDLDMLPQRTKLSAVWHKKNTNPILQEFLRLM